MCAAPGEDRLIVVRAAGTILAIAVLGAVLGAGEARGWGNRTHPAVVRLAIETLPAGMRKELHRHRRALQRFSNEPDSVLRERIGRAEAIRHFIDLDGYMAPPFRGFPRSYGAAVERMGKRRVETYGVLPWAVLAEQRELEEALRGRGGDAGDAWVRKAGHLAHYVADAYQPLHLTVDYDGQKSGAAGIHRRLENDLVDARIERYEKTIQPELSPAKILDDIREPLFRALFASYSGIAVILRADRTARAAGPPESAAYESALEEAAGELCRRQLRAAAEMLGSIWRTAWEDASPDSDPG